MATKWNNKTPWNKDNYVMRCIGAEFGPSKSSGKPMITLEFEVAAPQEVDIAGEMYTVAGVKTKQYYVTQSIDESGAIDMEKTANIQKRLEELYGHFGLPFDGFNPENPDVSGFVGKMVWADVYGDAVEQRKSPTAEELKKGQKQGAVQKNPITGKPLIQYWPKINEIFGLATDAAGGQF